MCCTFGDTADVNWWRAHDLPLIPLISRDGRLSTQGGAYAGMTLRAARAQIVADLHAAGAIRGERATEQSVRVHERCGTPLEILESSQWFIRVLDIKAELIAAGRQITWHPQHMRTRYEHWVENLSWDWCISRQRFFGVPFPLWRCDTCSAIVLADAAQLPVDPQTTAPPHGCACGGTLIAETDVLDTWATSSVSPQIAGNMLDNPALFARLFPMALRPQAHDIIRTWAFDTIVKAHLHHGTIPWQTVLISGHAIDPAGKKLSKSKGNAPNTPEALLDRYSADALRYWACGGSPGADQLLDEDTIKRGEKLVTKLWNASRLIDGIQSSKLKTQNLEFSTPIDRAASSWLQRLITQATARMAVYDYAVALEATERFFWAALCDNYLELVKRRLYDGSDGERAAALAMLHTVLQTLLKMFAPFLPHVTEEIWSHMYATNADSLHLSAWPDADPTLIDTEAERAGEAIFTVVAHVRRFKSEQKIGLGTPLAALTIATSDQQLRAALTASAGDLRSATRARSISVVEGSGELSIRPVL